MKLLTTSEVADRLGLHRSRINVLIAEGRLPAERFGRVLLVNEKDLHLVEVRKPGRPRFKKPGKKKGSAKSAKE